ncbi:MAG: substrate-binding domain-containing protein [Tepidisphaerales bacterium]
MSKQTAMQSTKRFVGLGVAVLAAFAGLLAGCKDKGPTPTAGKPVIGVSLLTMTNPFFKDIADAMQAEAAKHGYEVIVTSGELDPARQKDQVKDFLVRKVNAIVLAPCDSKSIGTAIAEANKAGVPVFTADIACLAEGAKIVTHVATDNLEGGRVAGREMVSLLGGKGKIAIIDHPMVESGMLRTKGFDEEIAKAPGIKVVAKLPGQGARDKSFAVAQDILQGNPDLDAIFAINDPSALGVIAAIEKAGKADKVKVIGFDGQLEARQAVKEGKLHATVMQYPKQIGTMTIVAISKYMAGEKPVPQLLIPTGIYRQADAMKDVELK